MTAKMKPATPLPWLAPVNYGATHFEIQGGGPCRHIARTPRLQDAAYITHAANAYPQLVEEVRGLRDYCRAAVRRVRGKADKAHYGARADLADTILRSLGEDA